MRPKSIVLFERIVLLSLLLGIVNSLLISDRLTADAAAQGMSGNSVFVIQAITIVIYLLLIYFISRKASPVAKWIYVVLGVLGIVIAVAGISQTLGFGIPTLIITIVQYGLLIASIWLLFRPDANAWFADGRG